MIHALQRVYFISLNLATFVKQYNFHTDRCNYNVHIDDYEKNI